MSVDKFIENGQTFSETCIKNNGKYHKICRNKYDKHHFERFKKKHETTVEEEEIISEPPRKLTRSSFDSIAKKYLFKINNKNTRKKCKTS